MMTFTGTHWTPASSGPEGVVWVAEAGNGYLGWHSMRVGVWPPGLAMANGGLQLMQTLKNWEIV